MPVQRLWTDSSRIDAGSPVVKSLFLGVLSEVSLPPGAISWMLIPRRRFSRCRGPREHDLVPLTFMSGLGRSRTVPANRWVSRPTIIERRDDLPHQSIGSAEVQDPKRPPGGRKLAPRLALSPVVWVGLRGSGWDENRWYCWDSLIAVRAGRCLVMRRSGVLIPEAALIETTALQRLSGIRECVADRGLPPECPFCPLRKGRRKGRRPRNPPPAAAFGRGLLAARGAAPRIAQLHGLGPTHS